MVNAKFYGRKSDDSFPHIGVIVEGNRIVGVCNESEIPENIQRVDMQGCNVAPGFIDLLANGAGGGSFGVTAEFADLKCMGETMMQEGTTGFLAAAPSNTLPMYLKMQEAPLLILDEADKLSDKVLYFFISLYNALEGECGLLMVATSHLELRIRKGVKANRKGYNEIWSRVGRKCVTLKGVSAADITAVCEANGVTDPMDIEIVINDSESDLRRVRRKVHAILKGKEAAK